ncbi:MAG: UDP-N-acetylmuramoyl-tripeptide--D-alanyl-D-alanine ligase [Saprospiraceae bacterium]|jgi:UDP-N-acetylmuramoyl-tripeptide--D-alanyl-D-alanine ligase
MEVKELYELFRASRKVSTDSRHPVPGSLFFALKGIHFDGNDYAADALSAGAAYAVVDNPSVVRPDMPFILVEDTLSTLQQLARFHRRQFLIPIIAITGSNGKTTTKELVSTVLSAHYRTHFTKGNLNNHIGICLTLLGMPDDTEVAVVEMGANAQGEIAALCAIAEPTHGVVTNIGKAHLEGFGGLEGVKKGKSELYRFMIGQKGTVFINTGEDFLSDLSEGVQKRVFYGLSESLSPDSPRMEVRLAGEQPFLSVEFLSENDTSVTIHSQLIGRYNLGNLVTAIALGRYFKVPAEKIKGALEAYVPGMNRSQLLQKGTNTFILDAYNANPSSMEQALRNFARVPGEKKIAVLGAMFELGAASSAEHDYIARLALDLRFGQVILAGAEFQAAARSLGLPFFSNSSELASWFSSNSWDNTTFLLKGSRGMQMEKMLALV